MVSPLANDVENTWKKLLAGESGINTIEWFDTEKYPTKFCGEIKDFDVSDYMSPKEAKRCDVFIQYGLAAAEQAFQDCGIEVKEDNSHRIGVVIGSGIGGITGIEQNSVLLRDTAPKKISPFFVPGHIINMISGHVSIKYGLRGPNFAVTTACTTGTHAVGFAARSIMHGEADVMFAGGAEKGSSQLGMAGFGAARALSTRNDNPQAASRPWDKDRDGFVLSDGAGVLVLEEYEHAKARGAKIYAEMVGFGMSGDAYHITSPPEDGAGAALAMTNALNDAQMNPEQVSYVNAHGTSTKAGDLAESSALKSVLGEHAHKIAVSSTKSSIGHLLGAAGAVEAIFSVLAIRDQVAPATLNLDNPDEGCDLDFVPNTARQMEIDTVISNSFGFGGTNGSLVFKKI
jgi:3-oxoacyl-[acyl-carrier-protein] synthase II